MDVEAILSKLEEFNLVRLNRISGNWYSVYCPFHSGGEERRPSCGVLLHSEYRNGQMYPEGFWHCFTCGAAYTMEQAVSKILETHSISTSASEWLIANVPGYDPSSDFEFLIPESISTTLVDTFAAKKLSTDNQNYVSEEELASYRYTVPYMYERKLTDDIISRYDVGVDMNWVPPGRSRKVPCITFPVRDKFGRTLFICRRSIEGKLYNYPSGVTKPVYGIDMIPQGCKSVIICESIINALTAEAWGYHAVALLGTGNSYQVDQLRKLGVYEYVLAMDGDEAGRRASKKLKRSLSDIALIWTLSMPDGKDVNDLSPEEFRDLYNNKI